MRDCVYRTLKRRERRGPASLAGAERRRERGLQPASTFALPAALLIAALLCSCRHDEDLVDLEKEIPGIVLDIRYATTKHGFEGLDTEWWHFDFGDWRRYEILDVDYSRIR